MGQSKTTTESRGTNNSEPWALQQPYLLNAFQAAGNSFGQTQDNAANPTYGAPTQFQAQYTPQMMQAFQDELGYGTQNGHIAQGTANTGDRMMGIGTDAARSGLYGLSNFNPTGGTQYNIDAANQYVQGADVPGLVAASMRDANQNYNDITAPAIQRNAAGSGNINSTAPAIQQGIVQRGLAQRAMDTSATLRNSLFQNGLQLGNTQANQDTTARLAALQGAASGGTGAVNSGVYGNTAAVGQQAGLYNIANTGAQNLNSGNQAGLTNQLQAYNFGQNSPFTGLNNFYNIVGNRNWGQQGQTQSTGTTTNSPSPLSMISGGIGMLGSLF